MLRPLWRITLLIFLLNGTSAFGCQCGELGPNLRGAFENAEIAFVGTVLDVAPFLLEGEHPLLKTRNRLRVETPWKAVDSGDEIEVASGWGGGDCGVGFDVGEQYLVFASRLEGFDEYVTSICNGSHEMTDRFSKCISLSRDQSPTGILWGDVRPWSKSLDLTGAYVSVTKEGFERLGPVTTKGSFLGVPLFEFAMEDLPLGDYEVTLHVPEAKDPDPWTFRTSLKLPVPCVGSGFSPRLGGRLMVRVVDSTGQPASNLRLQLEKDVGLSETLWTDPAGLILRRHEWPGTYWLRTPVIGPGTNAGEFVYLADPSDSDQPLKFKLEVGDIVDLGEFGLPFELMPALMRGRVLLPDGRPVEGANVRASDVSFFALEAPSTVSNQEGYFELQLHRHLTYGVRALIRNEAREPLWGKREWRYSEESDEQELLIITLEKGP